MTIRRKCEDCDTLYPADLDKCTKCGTSEAFSEPVQENPLYWGYDIETYPGVFTVCFTHVATMQERIYEVSYMRDDSDLLLEFINWCKQAGVIWVGFNNEGFDYPVVHQFAMFQRDPYETCMAIINSTDRFANTVWPSDRMVKQVDLFKIHHFDNVARSTSLKMLENNMRSRNIEDLPFPPGTKLTPEQIPVLRQYNRHDVRETLKFLARTIPMIEFRDELSAKYGRDFTNHNDTKIGKDYFVMELERQGVKCFDRINGRRVPRQTIRHQIPLADVIFSYVQFEQPEFRRVLDWLRAQVITETKGVFKDLHCEIDGFTFDFGTGGIHGSIPSQVVHSDDEYVIEDWDVASYYPNLAIANGLYPAHLGVEFCSIYKDLYIQRKGHAKGTPENAMLKLALNGVYGDSNNVHSPFYDPAYTMSITINGQLLLCMLAEQLIKTPGLTMVQINTDGLTIRYPRTYQDHVHAVCTWWEKRTNLQLESAVYSRMCIRDVNSYIAEYADGGKLKRKGAYCYGSDLAWHQNHSSQVVARAAEAALIYDNDIREFIGKHDDLFDFMLRTKVPRNSQLMLGDRQVQNITRFIISSDGDDLVKVSPPTGRPGTWKRKNGISDKLFNEVIRELTAMPPVGATDIDADGTPWDERIHTKSRSKHEERRMGICVGWKVTECNDAASVTRDQLNMEYYVAEATKLVKPLMGG